ncbi:MAG: hypothetical protein ACP5KZ_08310 [bacterium]
MIRRGEKIVEANRFLLKDEQRRVRAEIGMRGTDPTISFFDEEGRRRCEIGLKGHNSFIAFLSDEEEPQMELAKEDQAQFFRFGGVKGYSVELSVSEGGVNLVFRDKGEKPKLALALEGDIPALLLFSEAGEPRARLMLSQRGVSLSLLDDQSRGGMEAEVFDNIPSLSFYSPDGDLRMEFSVEGGEPSIALFGTGEDAKVLIEVAEEKGIIEVNEGENDS